MDHLPRDTLNVHCTRSSTIKHHSVDPDTVFSDREPITMADHLAEEELTPLQQEVLDEYDRLATNMKKVSRDSSLTRCARFANISFPPHTRYSEGHMKDIFLIGTQRGNYIQRIYYVC